MEKYYFQARYKWARAFGVLTDEETGRLMRAVWNYAETGEKAELGIREGIAFEMIISDLEEDEARAEALSKKRRDAINKRWQSYTKNTNVSLVEVCNTNDSNNNNKDNNNNKNNNNNKDKESSKDEKRRRFSPPTIEQVTEYCRERGNQVDPQRFIDYYESKGWTVGSSRMKDWKAAVRTWEQNSWGNDVQPRLKRVNAQMYEQRSYDDVQESLEEMAARLEGAR